MADESVLPTHKICSKCHIKKTLEAFRHAPHKNNPTYRRADCYECELGSNTMYNMTHREQRRASEKVRSSARRDEKRIYNKIWREEHIEERRIYNKIWYEENKEERRVYNYTYRIEHREEISIYAHNYNVTHRLQGTHYQRKRRTREQGFPDTFTYEQEHFCRQYFLYACAVCGNEEGFQWIIVMDHWIPLSSAACPGTIATNMIPLCDAPHG